MTRTLLTAKFVEKVKPPQKGRAEYWDQMLPGFGLRITSNGRKSWNLMYRHRGRQRRMTIGGYPCYTLQQAREEARTALQVVQKGADPIALRVEEQSERQDSFYSVGQHFIEKHAKLNNKTWLKQARRLENHVYPTWKTYPIAEIAQRDVVLLLDTIFDKAGPGAAEDVLKVIRKLFNWAIERGILEANPALHVKPPIRTQARERVLSDEEISAIWQSADTLPYPYGTYIKLLILTGQRVKEVGEMRWDEISGDIWTIPGERVKNGRDQVVPLSSLARDVLEACPRWNNGPYVFSTTGGERPIACYAKIKNKVVEQLAVPIADWRFHDFRRTFATGLAQLGFSDEVIARALNHKIHTVTARYNRHAYLEEKRDSMEKWALYLKKLLR